MTTSTDIYKIAAQECIIENVANVLCRLAARMPYCDDEAAQNEWRNLRDQHNEYLLMITTDITTWEELLERAIRVRAASEIATTEAGA